MLSAERWEPGILSIGKLYFAHEIWSVSAYQVYQN